MQYLFLSLLFFSSMPSFANCYRLQALSDAGSATSVCLDSEVSVYQASMNIYSFQAVIQFIPAHDVYQQGLLEGHEIHVPAANEYSGNTSRASIRASLPVLQGFTGSNSGCSGQLELDGANYCFFPDSPISATVHMCSINADLPCHFGL